MKKEVVVNILIIGGLLGLAILALLGAVVLGMGEERAEKARQEEKIVPPPAPASSQPSQKTEVTLPSTPMVTRATLPSEESESRTLELHRNNQLMVPDENEHHALLNGQVQRMTGELRALARKANELELNLSTLSEALEHQQQQRQHQVDSSDQIYTPKTDA